MGNLQRHSAEPDLKAMLGYIATQNPHGVRELALQEGIKNPPQTHNGMVKFLLKGIEKGGASVADAVFRLHPDFFLFDNFIREEIESRVSYESFNGVQSETSLGSKAQQSNGYELLVANAIVNDRKGLVQVLNTVAPSLPILYTDEDLVDAALSLSETGKASLVALLKDNESYAVPIAAIAQGVGALANVGSAAIQGGTQKKLAAIASRDNTLNSVTAIRLAKIQAQAASNQQSGSKTNQTLIWVGVGFGILLLIGLITFVLLRRK